MPTTLPAIDASRAFEEFRHSDGAVNLAGVTRKILATALAVCATAGGAAAGLTVALPASPIAVQPVVFGAPLPLDPAADAAVAPTVDQLSGVLYGLADPAVPFASKSYLVEGGIGRLEARAADGLMQKAVAKGQMPLSFAIANIAPVGPGLATATVTATGPATPASTQSVTFVDQGGWKLSRASATAVLSMFSA